MAKTKEFKDDNINDNVDDELQPKKHKHGVLKLFVKLIVAAVLIVLVVWQLYSWWSGDGFLTIGEERYQAVFLDNNQVYFGKLSRMSSDYPVLRDIFYLRLTPKLQSQGSDASAAPDINLIKLGTELHGPKDEMKINKDHILFIEDLNENSQVLRAILDFKAFQASQAQQ